MSIGFMKRSHFTTEQIVFTLRQAESGTPVAEVCRNTGIVEPLEDAREKVEEWQQHYNRDRPHGSLGNTPPVEYAEIHMTK